MARQIYPKEHRKVRGSQRSQPLKRLLHINGAEWRWEVDKEHARIKILPMATRELICVGFADFFGIDDEKARTQWRDYCYDKHGYEGWMPRTSILPSEVKSYIEDHLAVGMLILGACK